MESLCQIKIPPHIFTVLMDNRDLINQHFEVTQKLEAEAQRLTSYQLQASQGRPEDDPEYNDGVKSTIKGRS